MITRGSRLRPSRWPFHAMCGAVLFDACEMAVLVLSFYLSVFFSCALLCPSSCLCFFASCAPARAFAFLSFPRYLPIAVAGPLFQLVADMWDRNSRRGSRKTIITSLSVRGAVWSESVVCRPGWGLECVSVMAAKSRLNAAVLLSCTSAEEAGRSKFTTPTAKPIISTTESSPAYT